MTFLRQSFPKAITFLYLPDEPGRSEYKYIRQLADNIHSNPGPGKALLTFAAEQRRERQRDQASVKSPQGFPLISCAEPGRHRQFRGGRHVCLVTP